MIGSSMTTKLITIDVISDVVCPWCFLGRQRLKAALAMLPELNVEVRWRPFQLDPALPKQGKERKRYLVEKLGSQSRVNEAHDQLMALGKEADIEFDFDAIEIAPNTLDAHRLIHWAGEISAELQDRVVGELFSMYFEQGLDIGSHEILVEAAEDTGMEYTIIETLLADDTDKQTVQTQIETASQMGVTGVPCFIIDQKYAVMGAQSAEALADAIAQIADGFEPGVSEDR